MQLPQTATRTRQQHGAHILQKLKRFCAGCAVGTMMASLAEGLALAAQAGLSQAELLDIISLGAMANPMFKLKVR